MCASTLLHVVTRDAWRNWLEQHHVIEHEVWLVYYKKESGQPRISYDDAVEEALCFGWIDSIVKRLDNDRFAQKFTPRVNIRKWSEINKQRLRKMIDAGRMTPAGLAKIGDALDSRETETPPPYKHVFTLSTDLEAHLRKNKSAWAFFETLPPSQQKLYVRWIMSAVKEETRLKRVKESIKLLANKQRLGLK